MHRVRDRLVQGRTALINEIRGFLLERGMTFAVRPTQLRKKLPEVIEDAEQNLSSRLRWLLERLWLEWKQVDHDIQAITEEIEPSAKRMRSAGGCAKFPASVRWSPAPPWPRLAMELPFAEDATWPPGWASYPNNTPPVANRNCWASASAATSICDAC